MGELINLSGQILNSQIPDPIARDTEVADALSVHLQAGNPHPQYLAVNPVGIEFASILLSALDFHTGTTYRDFDVRLLASGGGATNGLGELLLQAALFRVNASFALNGGAQLSRLLTATTSVDLPPIAAGGTTDLSLNIANAVVGDLAFFCPTQLVTNISFFNIRAIINSAGMAQVRFHNLATSTLDIAAFTGRLLVIGFG
jgi:hypothetical protein